MKLHRTTIGPLLERDGEFFELRIDNWDELLGSAELSEKALARIGPKVNFPFKNSWLPPIGSQEVWAAGVTYYRSRDARIAESKESGGGSFYDRVYNADRPELFFKAIGPKVVGPFGNVRVRSDARWSVPEPELALLISASGTITGYTIGNDVSSRDIEGENPLYLPQAKVYDGSCALGPSILIRDEPMPLTTTITLTVRRGERIIFMDDTSLDKLKRPPQVLVEFLCKENTFPHGAFLLTGTGIVPSDDFSLVPGDEITIDIDDIGSLTNFVA